MSKARKLAITLMSVLFALTLMLGLVACGGQSAKEAIDAYLLPQDNALVDADFTLPKKIGIDNGVEVTWTSDNAAITIEDGTADAYNAKVTLQDEITPVKLTISAGGASKEFTVRVDALTVYTFMNKYTNEAFSKAQHEDFALDSSFTIQGKTATITWSVESAKDRLTLYVDPETPEEGETQTAKVLPGDDIEKVTLTGHFTYKGETKTQNYTISVSPELDHRQLIHKIYSVADFPVEFSGYIVHVSENGVQQYGNATFFAIDDEDFCSGYYFYRAPVDAADESKLVAGAHFTFSGDTAKLHNSGLWETSGNNSKTAKVVFDDKPAINVNDAQYTRAIDVDLMSGVQSLLWNESRLVSVTGWKVSKAWDSEANGITLKNGDTEVLIYSSSYVALGNAKTELETKLKSFAVDDIVTVKGLLGNYNGTYQIQPRNADDITTAEDAKAYSTDAAKIKTAQTAVNSAVEELTSGLITETKTADNLPTTGIPNADGVTVSYRLARKNTADAAAQLVGNTITVTPNDKEQNNLFEVTYTLGDYKAYSVFEIHSWSAQDDAIMDEVYNSLLAQKIEAVKEAGEFDLPTTELYNKAEIEWTITAPDPVPEWVHISGNKLVIDYLPNEATTVRLKATITCGSETPKDVPFSVKVSAVAGETFQAITEAKAGTYKLGMYSANKGETYYATGAMDGYYLATTTNVSEAADFVITQNGTNNEYTIQVGGKYVEIFAAASGKANAVDIKLNDAQTVGKYWQWVDAIQNFVFESTYNKSGEPDATDLYYFGNYSTFTSMGANYIGRITSKSDDSYTANGKEGVEQWVAHYGAMVTATDETRANEILTKCKNAITETDFLADGEITLYTSKQYGAVISYTLSDEDNANIKLQGTTLTITQGDADATNTLTITVKVGNETVTDTITITVKAISNKMFVPSDTEPAAGDYYIAMEANNVWYYLTGEQASNNYQLATTADPEEAAQFTLTATDGGYTIQCKKNNKWLVIVNNNNHVNSLYVDEAGDCVWVWVAAQKTFKVTVDAKDYFFGNYGDRTGFMNASEFGYLDGSKPSSSAQYASRLGTLEEMDDDAKAQEVLNSINLTTREYTATDTTGTALPTSTQYGADVTWTVVDNPNDYVSISGKNILQIDSLPDGEAKVTLKVTVKVGSSGDKAKTFEIKLKKPDPNAWTLTGENVFSDVSGTDYAKYDNDYTVDNYSVTTYQIMRTTYNGVENAFQFRSSPQGELIVGGGFTKVTLNILSTSVYSSAKKPTVTVDTAAGDPAAATLTEVCVDFNLGSVYSHTVSVKLTGDDLKCVSIKNASGSTLYIASIEFSKTAEAAAHTHAFGAYTSKDDDTHTQSCSGCGYTVESAHRYADNADTSCEDCNYTRTIDNSTWTKVTDVSGLTENMTFVLVYGEYVNGDLTTTSSGGYLSSINGATTEDEGATVSLPGTQKELILVKNGTDWVIKDSAGADAKTLVVTDIANTAKLAWKTVAELQEDAEQDGGATLYYKWTITFDANKNNEAIIKLSGVEDTGHGNQLQYNTSSGGRFGNYKQSQKNPFIYVKGDAE